MSGKSVGQQVEDWPELIPSGYPTGAETDDEDLSDFGSDYGSTRSCTPCPTESGSERAVEDNGITEAIKQLWADTATFPLQSTLTTGEIGGLRSCWEFEDVFTHHPLRRQSLASEPSQKIVQKSIEELNVNPEHYRIFPTHTSHIVGWKSIFLLMSNQSGTSGKNPIDTGLFKIEVFRPDKSTEQLFLKSSVLGPHHCSFLPMETGIHFLSITVNAVSNENPFTIETRHIQGSPLVLNALRCYPNSNDCNYLMMQIPSPMPFCCTNDSLTLAVLPRNNWIYVANRVFSEILILSEDSKIISKFGKRGSAPGELLWPGGIAVDRANDRVLVSDEGNNRISVFDLEGKFLFIFGKKGHYNGELNHPLSIAVSPNGQTVAVFDSGNHRIQAFDASGKYLWKSVFKIDSKVVYDHQAPRGLAFSLDGAHIYVTDTFLNVLYVHNLRSSNRETIVLPGWLNYPQGITVDEAGNIIVADTKNNCIRVMTPVGRRMCTLNGSGQDEFYRPTSVAVLRGGRVAVIDKGNRLRIF